MPSILNVFPALLLAATLICGTGCAHHHRSGIPSQKISITYRGKASRICLSGDFNGWSTDTYYMKRKNDIWSIRLELPPGRYAYTLFVNGTAHIADPEALLFLDDGFGSLNSILVVE